MGEKVEVVVVGGRCGGSDGGGGVKGGESVEWRDQKKRGFSFVNDEVFIQYLFFYEIQRTDETVSLLRGFSLSLFPLPPYLSLFFLVFFSVFFIIIIV